MYIKYDELDLLEFFEEEPKSLFDSELGIYSYIYHDDKGFDLDIGIDIYAMEVSIRLNFNKNIVFSGKYIGIKEIRKSGKDTLTIFAEEKNIVLKRYPQLGVILELI